MSNKARSYNIYQGGAWTVYEEAVYEEAVYEEAVYEEAAPFHILLTRSTHLDLPVQA